MMWPTVVVFGLTYLGLAVGRIPGLRIDRAGIALVGATLVLCTGCLTLDQAVRSDCVDYKTLLLLFGMMVTVGALRLSGVFDRLVGWLLRRVRGPYGLLAATVAASGVLSAVLINDVVCLALTPLVIRLARRLGTDPVPHLLGLATAANVGSTGTITGNPQNIYIGSHSGITYSRFAVVLMPLAVVGLGLTFLIIAVAYRRVLSVPFSPDRSHAADAGQTGTRVRPPVRQFQTKTVAVTLVTVGLFFTGLPLELIALGSAAVLFAGRVRPEKLYREVDWSLLVLFASLFVVVHAFEVHVVRGWEVDHWTWLLGRPVDLLSGVSAALSNLVSNVPAVLLLEPLVRAMPAAHRDLAWFALAMSSTFAGNLTVLGSVANLIVVENARRSGVTVSFWHYCAVGVPLTLVTLAAGVGWLLLVKAWIG